VLSDTVEAGSIDARAADLTGLADTLDELVPA
jgi:hypothetical protein